ncbi:MAG TPA: sensor histidine kinase [Streptosporangiaceae bacterium]|nr:sensor histidine kinase [Streptosporangiaceae bacterium]
MAADSECAGPYTDVDERLGVSPGQEDAKLAGGKLGLVLRWFFSGIWLIYLVSPLSELFDPKHPHSALYQAGAITLVAVFCVVYVFLLGTWYQNRARGRAGLVALVALAVAISLIYGANWTSIFIYVSSAAGFIIWDRRRALLGVAACTVLYVLLSLIVHTKSGDLWAELLPVALIGFAMIGFKMQIVLNVQLRQARGAVAKLAANEERLRLARDMHDLTGQSLSLITLKSELAVKRLSRLPASPEVDAVAAELGDIGRVSRQTLHDIREAVSGYRRPTLAIEIITARTSMEAAGIQLDDDPALMTRSGTFDPEAEAALAWCLREAATNVIRHSGAQRCRIRLVERRHELSLEISDDGRGLADGGTGSGSGLHNMSERLSAVGGRFSAEPAAREGHGFRVVATVPLAPAGSPARPAETGPVTPAGTGADASVRS